TYTLVVGSASSLASGSTITNIVTVSSNTNEPNPNAFANSFTKTTNVIGGVTDLLIGKCCLDTVTPGNDVTYTITAKNNGPSDSANVVVSDTVPAGITALSVDPVAGWSCPIDTESPPPVTDAIPAGTSFRRSSIACTLHLGVYSCALAGTMPPNTSQSFTIVFYVNLATAPGTTIANTAGVGLQLSGKSND